jgi:phasin family protein
MAQENADLAVSTLKQNIEASLRMIEAITEATRKVHETQLKAVAEMQASTEAVRKQFEHASNPQELWRIQTEWMNGGLEKSLGYWREFFEAAAEAQSTMSKLPMAATPKQSRHAH